MPYKRVCFQSTSGGYLKGVEEVEEEQETLPLWILADSGGDAAGFELDCSDPKLDRGEHTHFYILAQSFDKGSSFMLVPEEVLTTYSTIYPRKNKCDSDEKQDELIWYTFVLSQVKYSQLGALLFVVHCLGISMRTIHLLY